MTFALARRQLLAPRRLGAVNILLADLVARDRDFDVDGPALRLTAGNADDHVSQRDARHPLGLLDRGADGIFGGIDVDDRPAAHAAADLVADAQDFKLRRAVFAQRRSA